MKKTTKLQLPKKKLHKIRKPRAIHKPEQVHKDKRKTFHEDDSNWKQEVREELDDYYDQ